MTPSRRENARRGGRRPRVAAARPQRRRGELYLPGAHTNEQAIARDVALLLEPGVPDFYRPIDPEDAPEAKILAMGSISDELKWMLTLPGIEDGDLRVMTRPQVHPGCALEVSEFDPEARGVSYVAGECRTA